MSDNTTHVNGACKLEDGLPLIHTRDDFIRFAQALYTEFKERPERWENRDLGSFLEAMAAWVKDMEGFYRNRNELPPERPTWETLAQILLAARVYE